MPCGFPTRHISHSVPVAPCATHLRLAPRAQHVQPLKVPVCKPVHVKYLALACSDGMGLLGLALALRARADIEVCAVEENAAARQGGSADGMARSWRPAGAPDAPWASPWRRMDAQVVGAYERGSRPALDPAHSWCTHRLTYGVYGRPLWRPSQHLDPLTFRSSTVPRLAR